MIEILLGRSSFLRDSAVCVLLARSLAWILTAHPFCQCQFDSRSILPGVVNPITWGSSEHLMSVLSIIVYENKTHYLRKLDREDKTSEVPKWNWHN